MTSPDDRWRPAPDGRDIVESAPREWPGGRRRLGVIVLTAAALLIGLAGGYAAGARTSPDTTPAPSPSAAASGAAAAGAAALTITGGVAGQQDGQCSAQVGRELQLGVDIVNQSSQSLILRHVRPVLPLGGLQVVAEAWGTCGELAGAGAPGENVLPANGTAWLTVTFRVLVRCPSALPVQFAVTFAPQHPPAGAPGFLVTSRLPGFVDLGDVPYGNCPPTS